MTTHRRTPSFPFAFTRLCTHSLASSGLATFDAVKIGLRRLDVVRFLVLGLSLDVLSHSLQRYGKAKCCRVALRVLLQLPREAFGSLCPVLHLERLDTPPFEIVV